MNTNRFRFLALAAALLAPAALHAQFSQPVRNVENPAQNLYVDSGFRSASGGFVAALMEFPALPAGKRLTVEALSIQCRVPNAASVTDAYVTTKVRLTPGSQVRETKFRIHMTRQGEPGTSTTVWVGSLQGRVFMDAVDALSSGHIYVFRAPANTAISRASTDSTAV